MKLILSLIVVMPSLVLADDLVVKCSNLADGTDFIQFEINDGLTATLTYNLAEGTQTASYENLSYKGGFHQYTYSNKQIALRMNEFSTQEFNAQLTGVFSHPLSLACCAANSATFPLSLCE